MDSFLRQDCSNNLLYPREDKVNSILLYACRRCGHQEESVSTCVFRHEILLQDSGEGGYVRNLASDPTLPRSRLPCPQCQYPECVYFQSRSNSKDAKMTLFYVCSRPHCGHLWTSV
ncbi:DNA-directed RNA polymerase II subunit RPB9 [Coelomomyces lativittatus]|nr:DNA-directed RNA polymerase II subunit RPB9 [Coelomomyces lativittatus]